MKQFSAVTLVRSASNALILGAMSLLLSTHVARADDLNLGGTFTSPINGTFNGNAVSEGGGSVDVSFLNGKQLPWVYCVDIPDIVFVPADYSSTTVTNNGMANFDGTFQAVNNAGEVAWLLDTYANSASAANFGGNRDHEAALQGAIWSVIFDGSAGAGGNKFVLNDGATVDGYEANYLTGLSSAPVSTIDWLSPGKPNDSTIYQGLATVPEPAFVQMAALLGLGGLAIVRRYRRA